MDNALYKDFKTSRGFNYHYYYSPAQPGKRTLLFLHGFPSHSTLWAFIAPHFKDKGYGVLVPDLLGYGGTDKPTDPSAYLYNFMTKDITDILDAEKLDRVVAIGHDWGSALVSRLANYAPERCSAYAFFALGFWDVWPDISFQEFLDRTEQAAGYQTFGYWPFFTEADVDETIQAHLDSFIDIWFGAYTKVTIDRLGASGALKRSLLEDYRGQTGAYFTDELRQDFVSRFRKGGFTAPTNWYKLYTLEVARPVEKLIPDDRKFPPVSAPLFFGSAKKDPICIAHLGVEGFQRPEFKDHEVTIREYDGDHWLVLSVPQEITRDLEAWIEGL